MFKYTLDFKSINFRDNPHLYRIGKGEQGVLLVEPYRSEYVFAQGIQLNLLHRIIDIPATTFSRLPV